MLEKCKVNFGLCCLFKEEKIQYKTYTKSGLLKLSLKDQREKVKEIIFNNIKSLQQSFDYCYNNDIKSFRMSSDVIPHSTYIRIILSVEELENIYKELKNLTPYDLVLSMHPSQIVNLGSPSEEVVRNSIEELKNHWLIFDKINTKTKEINIHLGGGYGDKKSAKERFIKVAKELPFLKNITIENDELTYSIEDCLEVSKELNIPVTFDIHHHKCHLLNKDYKSEYTDVISIINDCKKTWIKRGYNHMRIHLSSPKDGYSTSSKSRPHTDLINEEDMNDLSFLKLDNDLNIHIDVEAKHKEVAVFKVRDYFKN